MTSHRDRLPASLRNLLELHPAHLSEGFRYRDLAYACFLYFGIMLAVAFLLNGLPTHWWLYGVVADRFGAAVLFGFLPAGVGGVGSVLFRCRDRPLVVLALATAGVPVVLWLASRWPAAGAAYFTVFTVLALVLPARWFFSLRRHLQAAAGN